MISSITTRHGSHIRDHTPTSSPCRNHLSQTPKVFDPGGAGVPPHLNAARLVTLYHIWHTSCHQNPFHRISCRLISYRLVPSVPVSFSSIGSDRHSLLLQAGNNGIMLQRPLLQQRPRIQDQITVNGDRCTRQLLYAAAMHALSIGVDQAGRMFGSVVHSGSGLQVNTLHLQHDAPLELLRPACVAGPQSQVLTARAKDGKKALASVKFAVVCASHHHNLTLCPLETLNRTLRCRLHQGQQEGARLCKVHPWAAGPAGSGPPCEGHVQGCNQEDASQVLDSTLQGYYWQWER